MVKTMLESSTAAEGTGDVNHSSKNHSGAAPTADTDGFDGGDADLDGSNVTTMTVTGNLNGTSEPPQLTTLTANATSFAMPVTIDEASYQETVYHNGGGGNEDDTTWLSTQHPDLVGLTLCCPSGPPLPPLPPLHVGNAKPPNSNRHLQRCRGHSPTTSRTSRYTPSPNSRGNSPNSNGTSSSSGSNGGNGVNNIIGVQPMLGQTAAAGQPPGGVPNALAPNVGPAQHVVHLHVNPGEAISIQIGDQLQLIQGPATVRMVSNNASPPIPMPVHVPPGHMVQQIVDENGTLRHVILSPQPPMSAVPMGPSYGPGPAPNTGPTSPHYYAYPPPYAHHHPPPPQYHPHPHPTGPPPPPPNAHLQPQGVSPTMHGQPPTLTQHQCNSHISHQGPSPPPPTHHQHKDERIQRQVMKMKRKLEARHRAENSTGVGVSSPPSSAHATVIPTSPKKESSNASRKFKDRNTSTSGLEDVTAVDESNVQDEEETRLLTELLSKVFPPTVSEIDARSALVHWKPPEVRPLTALGEPDARYADFAIQESEFAYEVLLSDRGKDGKYRVAYTGHDRQHKLTELKPATEYHVCLQAVLEELRGNMTDAISFKTKSCEPDVPQPPKVINRTKTSLTLRWNAVADNGSRITCYLLEWDEGRNDGHFVEVSNVQQKQTKLTKLNASTCYRFRVTAVNDIGKSKPSEVVCYITSGSAPPQPSPPELKESFVNRLLLGWQRRPLDDEFSLQMEEESSGHGFLPVYNGKETHYTCSNLLRNTEYKFRLSANNHEGTSRWSDVVAYCTRPDRPSVPSKPFLKGRIHSSSFKVMWDGPKDNGGSDILKYDLEMDVGSGFELVYSGLETEFTCDHLQPGTVHRLRVCASAYGGVSEFSEIGSVTTLPVCPGQCSAPRLHGKPRATTLHLKWASPEYDGGSPVTEYEVEITGPDDTTRQVYQGRDLDCMVASLLPGRTYLFHVRAYNKVGCGTWSEALEVVSGAGPPDRPVEPRVTFKSPHHAVLSWDEPASNGAPITEYRLEWSNKDGDFMQLFQGSGFSYELKNLTPATQYNFRLRAVNSAGASVVSETTVCTTPPSSPGAVSTSSIKATCTATSISLTWRAPPSNGSDILLYNVDLGERHPLVNAGDEPQCCINNLQPETTYRIRIQAVSSVGVGPFSSMVKACTLSLPPAPPLLECTRIGHNSLVVKWGEGKNADFTQYTLEMENKTGHFVPVYQGASLSQKVTKLTEMTDYRFRIFAANDAGKGPFSSVVMFTTCKAPPPTLKAPRVLEVTESSCLVEWLAAKPLRDDVIVYQLQLLNNNKEQDFKLVYKGSDVSKRLTGLEPKTEYSVRVGTVRQCRSPDTSAVEGTEDGDVPATPTVSTPDVTGPFSASTWFVTGERLRIAPSRPPSAPVVERKPLTDQQWAVIILVSFTLFAVLVAVFVQQLISSTSSS